jgi:hypothetical protein
MASPHDCRAWADQYLKILRNLFNSSTAISAWAEEHVFSDPNHAWLRPGYAPERGIIFEYGHKTFA